MTCHPGAPPRLPGQPALPSLPAALAGAPATAPDSMLGPWPVLLLEASHASWQAEQW